MLLSLILLFVFRQTGEGIEVIYKDQPGYTKWIAGLSDNSTSDAFMYCPTSCPSEEENRIRIIDIFYFHGGRFRCCASQASPFYHFFPYRGNVREDVLFVEYFSALGDARFVYMGNKSNIEHTFIKCRHNHGYLSSIPENKCTFPSILELDLSDNQIKTIGNLSCLTFLSVLDLHENRISYVRKGTFDKMYYLWKIDLSFNNIAWIDQSTLHSPHLQLKDMNFQSQRGTLTKVNISNLYPDRVFHFVDFSNNCIDEIINCDVDGPYPGCYSNWSINTFIEHKDHKRGGRLHLHLNGCLKPFPDIAKLFKTERDPSLLTNLKFYRYIIFCDSIFECSSELFFPLHSARELVRLGAFNLNCTDHITGQPYDVFYLFRENRTDIFRTSLNNSICPSLCESYDKPSLETVFLNCSFRGLKTSDTRKVTHIWQYHNTTVLLDNNEISSLKYFTGKFLRNVKCIDLSNNMITAIPRSFLRNLEKASSIDLRGNPITIVPSVLRGLFLRTCVLKIDAVIPCTCSELWLRDWLMNHDCGDDLGFACRDTGLSIRYTSEFDVCETQSWYIYLILAFVIIPIALVFTVHFFKNEVYLLIREVITFRKTKEQDCSFDIYICCEENSPELTRWLKEVFLPYFETQMYRVHWPERDFLPGSSIFDQVTSSVSKSANYVIFLTSAFCGLRENEDTKMNMEWRHIWNSYRKKQSKKIMLVNFDHVRYSNYYDRIMKAFIRLKLLFRFEKHLLSNIQEKIGRPLRARRMVDNKKPVYRHISLDELNTNFCTDRK